DRSQIFVDESFRLILTADDSVDDNPDLSILTADFEILGQSQSSNMSYVNGNYSRQQVWTLELIAKRTGALTIPSISFGKDQSPALRIQIKDPATAKKQPDKDQDVFLQVEINEDKAWVQSQVILNVRLFSRISMNNLRSSELETNDPDAIIKQLGDARSYEAFREGVRYAVHEQRYAIFPQHSGKLEIKPMIFEGRVNIGRARSFMDQFMNAGERKRVRSNAISIDVQAKPSNIKLADWLPAKGITISEQWSEDVSKLKNGDPVTRTITIIADGIMSENLPDLKTTDIDQLKQYPDKASLENKVSDQGIVSSKQIKVALIPTRSGGFKLPAIRIPWWNTTTGKQETAVLPEKLIRARGDAPKPAAVAPINTDSPIDKTENPTIKQAAPVQTSDAGYWPWLSLILAAGWLLTLVAFFRNKPTAAKTKVTPDSVSIRALEKAVYKHCTNNDASQTKDALLSWARACWPELSINSLIEINRHVTTELASDINELNSALYSSSSEQWQGKNLLNHFKSFNPNKIKSSKKEQATLEPLYK
ncbi:MAG: BatD family protein, partial [Gammaproteobacteria bacterium]|nr:BatD family protein [Gammaproteobacteria bacterium]